eukprot:Nk52_evm38s24 gene=Nk52_evmTU38s24
MKALFNIIVTAIALFCCPSAMEASPIASSSSITRDSIVNGMQDLGRPYPSVNVSSSSVWDMVMAMDFNIANSNFRRMHGDSSKFDLFRGMYDFDDHTLETFAYPPKSYMQMNLTFGPVSIGLDINKDDRMSMYMTSLSGSTVEICIYGSNDQCLDLCSLPTATCSPDTAWRNETAPYANIFLFEDIEFSVEAALNHAQFVSDQTTIYVENINGTNWQTLNYKRLDIPPMVLSLISSKVTLAFQDKTSNQAYPFVTYDNKPKGVDEVLIPTKFMYQTIEQRKDGKHIAMVFIMTGNRDIPSSEGMETPMNPMGGKDYLPNSASEDDNVLIIISNRLLVKEMIHPKITEMGLTVNSAAPVAGQNNGEYFYISGTYDTGLSFHSCPDYKIVKDLWITDCEYKNCGDTQVKFTGVKAQLDGNATTSLTFSHFYQKYTFAHFTRGSDSRGTITCADEGYRHAEVNYSRTLSFSASGTNLAIAVGDVGGTDNIPSCGSCNKWYHFETDFEAATTDLRRVKPMISSSLDPLKDLEGNYNLWKDSAVIFGSAKGMQVRHVQLVYDAFIFSKVDV